MGEVAPTLDVRWMVFPVYTTRGGASFLGALDHQLIYVFNVTGAAAAAPVIKQVLLAAGTYLTDKVYLDRLSNVSDGLPRHNQTDSQN